MSSDKHCHKCGSTKPAADFQKCARNSDGLQSHCRDCRTAAAVEYRARTLEYRREYNRAYSAAHKAERAAYFQANRDKFLAGMKVRYQANRAAQSEYNRAYYQENRERHAELGRAWREKNAEPMRAYMREYYEANVDRFNQYGVKRRASKRDQFVEHVNSLVVLERDDGVCGICGGDVDPLDFHVDHIIPLSRGGEHSYANTQAAHPFCNLSKHDRLPDEVAA